MGVVMGLPVAFIRSLRRMARGNPQGWRAISRVTALNMGFTMLTAQRKVDDFGPISKT
jgi:hypothetical protein